MLEVQIGTQISQIPKDSDFKKSSFSNQDLKEIFYEQG